MSALTDMNAGFTKAQLVANRKSFEAQCETGRDDLELVIEELERQGRGKGDPVYDSALACLNNPAQLLWYSRKLEREATEDPDPEIPEGE